MAQVPVNAGQVNVSEIASVIASDPVAQAALSDKFLPNTGGTITGETILCYPGGDPCLWFKDPLSACDNGGLWRILMENDTLSFQRNTGVFTHTTNNVVVGPPDAFVIPGSFVSQFPLGFTFSIVGGLNAGTYTVHPTGASFAAGNTTIPVVETIPVPGPGDLLEVCDFSSVDVPLEMTSLNLVSTVPVSITHPQGLEFPVPASTIRFMAPNGSIQFLQPGGQISSGVFPIEIVALSLMSSAPIAMNPAGTHKITGIANGTAMGDALHFGQIGTQVQAFDPDLTALSALGPTGFAARTAADTWALRTLTGVSGNVTITNPMGVAGDPDFDLLNVGTPVVLSFVKITTDTKGRVSATTPVVAGDITTLVDATYVNASGDTMTGNLVITGFKVTGLANATVSGDALHFGQIGVAVQAFDAELTAIAALAGTGIIAHTGAGTVAERTILGGVGVTVTNGNGVSGDPSVAVDSFKGSTTFTFGVIVTDTVSTSTNTLTVTGALSGDIVTIGLPATGGPAGFTYSGYVSAADTVSVRAASHGGAIGAGAADVPLNVIVFPFAAF